MSASGEPLIAAATYAVRIKPRDVLCRHSLGRKTRLNSTTTYTTHTEAPAHAYL